MQKLFGTDGVRGVANRELTPEMALTLGRAAAHVLSGKAPKILIGKDTRKSSDMLEAALTAGLCAAGATVYHAGTIPTPGIAYLVRHYGMDAGAMISASHNAMPDNGIKFFSAEGTKLPDAMEAEIESHYYKAEAIPRPEGADVGQVNACENAAKDYATYLISSMPELDLRGLNIALDCANGATSAIAAQVFEAFGATVHTIHNTPDGKNINENCGSTHMQALQEYVRTDRFDVGLAFDGDGDRVLAVDDKGMEVDGDVIMAICGLDMYKRGKLPGNAIVATVMSNLGLVSFCREQGIILHRTQVGDRYVSEKMIMDGCALGGEQSGHIIFAEHAKSGDGILTGLHLLGVLAREKQPLSVLRQVMEIFPQTLKNIRIEKTRKNALLQLPTLLTAQKRIEAQLGENGRVLIRASGTEPLIRVMIEGREQAQIEAWAEELAEIIAQG